MPTWEARVSHATAPADRVDAEVRYAYAAPLIREAAVWVDLGCGTGVAAAAVVGDSAASAVLVDRDAGALADARRELGVEVAAAVEADLQTTEGVAAAREAIAAARAQQAGTVVVTCLDVLGQLSQLTALVELLVELGADATVVLSVPDDAAGALDDPHRASAWSAGAAEELRRLVPGDVVAARQVPVRAAAIVPAGATASVPLGAVVVDADQPAAHHLLAFGPQVACLGAVSRARAAALDAERADVRRRESDLAYLEARVAQLEGSGAA